MMNSPRRHHALHSCGSAAIAATLGLASLMVAWATPSRAYNDNVVKNCLDDYLAYCKQHPPESTDLRYCMEAHRNELSKQCIYALVDAGEVPRKYLIKQIGERK